MLSYTATPDWFTSNVWVCLLNVMSTYITSTTVEVHTDVNISPIVLSVNWSLYISDQFQSTLKPVTVSAVLITQLFQNIHLNGKYKQVIVLTTDIENVTSLWTRSRILRAVVLVPNKTHTNAYTWDPYSKENCFKKPILKLIDICEDGKWKSNNMISVKLQKQFFGCPVFYQSINFPPDNILQSDGIFRGREPNWMKMFAEHLNLSIHYKTATDFYNKSEESNGFTALIYRGEVDFAFASLILTYDFNLFAEPLPAYRDQPISWMFPKAKPQSPLSSLYSGFSHIMWALILLITIFSALLIRILSNLQKKSTSWLDLIAISFCSPIVMPNSRLLKYFLLYFQFYSLHIAWFYQATLLKNLVNPPMQKQITNAGAALDAGLQAYLYEWLKFSYNHTDYALWNKVLLPENGIITPFIPYEKIVVEKTAFFIGSPIQDGWALRQQYGGNLADLVYWKPYLSSHMTVYGHRGSPLTAQYRRLMLYAIESGIFWHLTTLEKGYNDLAGKGLKKSAEILKIEKLQGAFIFYGSLITIATLVFVMELTISTK